MPQGLPPSSSPDLAAAQAGAPPAFSLAAGSLWVVSDVHLDGVPTSLHRAIQTWVQTLAQRTQQLLLLGDWFEAWIGDDLPQTAAISAVSQTLRSFSQGRSLAWMHGNRDFLVGDAYCDAIGARRLPDPYPLTWGQHRLVLTHGDALCTDDHAYQQFRRQVRDPRWQAEFLRRSLDERLAIARQAREQSNVEKQGKNLAIMDVHPDAVRALVSQYQADVLIHGHTHRPALHIDGETPQGQPSHPQLLRAVCPDWVVLDDGGVQGGALRLDADGVSLVRAQFDGAGRMVAEDERRQAWPKPCSRQPMGATETP